MQNSYKSGYKNKLRGYVDVNEEKKLLRLRREAKELYFLEGYYQEGDIREPGSEQEICNQVDQIEGSRCYY